MLNKLKKTQAQFGGSSVVIDHWLEMRQNLIIEYCRLAALKTSHNKPHLIKLPSPAELQNFCLHVVDYISEGHFRIYDMVMKEWQATGFASTQEIDDTYAKIVTTTEPLLDYTDKYAAVNDEDELPNFERDLSRVGEVLEQRFEDEDYLIQLISESLATPPGA